MLSTVGAAMLATAACRPHVSLSAPDGSAPARERIEAYERLHAAGALDEVTTDGSAHVVSRTSRFLVLGDGRRVYHADDLVPVVDPDSPAAGAGRRSGAARRNAQTSFAVGAGSQLAGIGLFVAGASRFEESGAGSLMLSGLLLATIGGTAGWFVGKYFQQVEHDERVSAFSTYDPSLRSRLDICVEDAQVVPCPPDASASSGR